VSAALAAIVAFGGDTPRAKQASAADRQENPAAAGGGVRGQQTPTFRVGTRLATIDVVVVDGDGRHVTDLRAEEFEVTERGKRQTVRQVAYVPVIGPDGQVVPMAPVAGATAPDGPAAPARARPLAAGGSGLASRDRIGRVIAIVVDELGMSFRSLVDTRRGLTRYIEEGIAPGDLVAIIRTSGGVGTLQQFTTDKRLLQAAVDRIQYSLMSRPGVAAFSAATPDSSTALVDAKTNAEDIRNDVSSIGTLGALEYVLRGIETMPSRKSVVFVSEGFDIGVPDSRASRTWSAFTRVMDRANRSGVVVYTMDPRGLETGGLVAEDNPQTALVTPGPGGNIGDGAEQLRAAGQARLRSLHGSQDSLIYLAEQTGGFAVLNNNDLGRGMARIVDDTRGYYLLGFDTGLGPNDRWDPNGVRIEVTRRGLKVRARRGLFGPADTERPREAAPADPLVAATLAPFSTGDIDVRLTTLFAHDAKAGSFVRSLFFIDPANLTFVDGPDGRRDADLTLLLLAINDYGEPAGQMRRQLKLRLAPDEYQQLRQRGLLYSARVGVKEAGGYQIRAAVQDDRSQRIGTGSQFLDVPKVGKGRVALSGVVLMDVDAAPDTEAPSASGAADTLAEGVLGEPAIKIFKPGSEVAYTFEIYDGRTKRDEGFATTATLLRDGKAFYTAPTAPVGPAPKDAKPVGAVPAGGRLTLGRGLPRGTYTLQVSVGPQRGRGFDRTSQWVDFEVR
jgi:VWFA-related protein